MTPSPLTPDQQDLSNRIYATLQHAAATDLRAVADQLATTTDETIFGANEFVLRDLVLRLGAQAIETARTERKKGGTTGRPAPVPNAGKRPNSNAGNPKPL